MVIALVSLAAAATALTAGANPAESTAETERASGGDAKSGDAKSGAEPSGAADASELRAALQRAEASGDGDAALAALRALIEVAPEDRGVRLALAQRLLWTSQFADALPHARWLLARGDAGAPELETATWILLGVGDRDGALSAARRWLAAANATSARWIIADLTHWSHRWRHARGQYAKLATDPEHAAKAAARLALLARAHPRRVELAGTAWSDNLGVSYRGLSATARAPLTAPATFRVDADRGSYLERRDDQSVEIATTRVRAGVALDIARALTPEITAGAETDSAGGFASIAELAARFVIAGRAFGRVSASRDRSRGGRAAIAADVRATALRGQVYAELTPWLFASTDASMTWLSDANRRSKVLVAAGVRRGSWLQIEPRGFVQLDTFAEQRVGGLPYYTPDEPLLVGADVTARLAWRPAGAFAMTASVTGGLVRHGDKLAVPARAAVTFELVRHVELRAELAAIRAPGYAQTRGALLLAYWR